MKSKIAIVLENGSVIKCVPTSRGDIRSHAVDALREVLGGLEYDSDGTVSFRDGVDAVLDMADSIGGKITLMLVEDVGSGVCDLHVDMFYEQDIPANDIKIDFVVARTLRVN